MPGNSGSFLTGLLLLFAFFFDYNILLVFWVFQNSRLLNCAMCPQTQAKNSATEEQKSYFTSSDEDMPVVKPKKAQKDSHEPEGLSKRIPLFILLAFWVTASIRS